MRKTLKSVLYEAIMKNISRTVKRSINESFDSVIYDDEDEYQKTTNDVKIIIDKLKAFHNYICNNSNSIYTKNCDNGQDIIEIYYDDYTEVYDLWYKSNIGETKDILNNANIDVFRFDINFSEDNFNHLTPMDLKKIDKFKRHENEIIRRYNYVNFYIEGDMCIIEFNDIAYLDEAIACYKDIMKTFNL